MDSSNVFDVLAQGLLAVSAFGAAVYGGRTARRVSKDQTAAQEHVVQRKVDAEAYERAKGIYEGLVNELTEQLTSLHAQGKEAQDSYDAIRTALWKERTNARALEDQLIEMDQKIRGLRHDIAGMEDTVRHLRQQLVAAGQIPNN